MSSLSVSLIPSAEPASERPESCERTDSCRYPDSEHHSRWRGPSVHKLALHTECEQKHCSRQQCLHCHGQGWWLEGQCPFLAASSGHHAFFCFLLTVPVHATVMGAMQCLLIYTDNENMEGKEWERGGDFFCFLTPPFCCILTFRDLIASFQDFI